MSKGDRSGAAKNRGPWLWVGLCILAIFLLAPTARFLQKSLVSVGGRALLVFLVLAGVLLGLGAAFIHVYTRMKIRSPLRFLALLAAASVFAGYAFLHRDAPEEAVHFLEYGLLGYLLLRAIKSRSRDFMAYPTAFFAGTLVGILDEIMQWILPSRLWDLRDVGLNAAALGIVLLAVLFGLRPPGLQKKAGAGSVRTCSVLLSANILLLGLCLSNTPERVEGYTRRLPALSFLQEEEPMHERRVKHRDPDIGIFTSRLTAEWLEKTDLAKSGEHIRILEDWKERPYEDFLKAFQPARHPFLYEFRVHVFRRDRYLDKAAAASSAVEKRSFLTVAFKENRILQKYFGRTLTGSVYNWKQEDVRAVEAAADSAAPYKSPVGASPLGALTETSLWAALFVFLFLILAGNVLLGVKESRKRKSLAPNP